MEHEVASVFVFKKFNPAAGNQPAFHITELSRIKFKLFGPPPPHCRARLEPFNMASPYLLLFISYVLHRVGSKSDKVYGTQDLMRLRL
jgi:hypothetical protein